jgi:rubredoxin
MKDCIGRWLPSGVGCGRRREASWNCPHCGGDLDTVSDGGRKCQLCGQIYAPMFGNPYLCTVDSAVNCF